MSLNRAIARHLAHAPLLPPGNRRLAGTDDVHVRHQESIATRRCPLLSVSAISVLVMIYGRASGCTARLRILVS